MDLLHKPRCDQVGCGSTRSCYRACCPGSAKPNQVVIGEYFVDANGEETQGAVMTTAKWEEMVVDAGLDNQWLEIVIRPIVKT